MLSRLFLYIFISLSVTSLTAQVNCLPNAHSHNDYKQHHPLSNALSYRFASIEADVFLIRGELYVSHTYPFLHRQRLDSLYLEPLLKICNERNGKIYDNAPLILLIDVKSDAGETYQAIETLLEHYKKMLSSYNDGKVTLSAITVILTGNKPHTRLKEAKLRYFFIDQGLLSLGDLYPDGMFLMASTKYSSALSWKGKGTIPEDQRKRLELLTAEAHKQGKKVRLWASPENEAVWKTLLECGVDLINTDQLERLSKFLTIPVSR
jgi:hypothetical protein